VDKIKRITEFKQIWDIDVEPSAAFPAFRNRVIYAVNKVLEIHLLLSAELAQSFLALIGEEVPYGSHPFRKKGLYSFESYEYHPIYDRLSRCENEKELAYYLQYFMWAVSEELSTYRKYDDLLYEIEVAVVLSPGIKIKVVENPDLVDILPNDPPLYDQSIIDETLKWLYPYKSVYDEYSKLVNLFS
jgi:hypothetical protein